MNRKHPFLAVAAVAAAILTFAASPLPRSSPPPLSTRLLQGPSGTISAIDANLSSGTPTSGSTVACALGGVLNSLCVGVQGLYSATLIVQVTADNVNWVTVPSSAYTKVSDGTTGAISGPGMWTVPV